MIKKALILGINNQLEFNETLIYKYIFLGETSYLIERNFDNWTAEVIDIRFQINNLDELIILFQKNFDLIILVADVHHSRMALLLSNYAKKVSPNCKILIIGRATSFIPQYFYRFPVDAIHTHNDRELAILTYIKYLDQNLTVDQIIGLRIRSDDGQYIKYGNNHRTFDQKMWPFPDFSKLPIAKYQIFEKKLRTSITASKGCPYNCSYCGATMEEGKIDRRRDPKVLIQWINENYNLKGSIIHMYSPNILLDSVWVNSFCTEYTDQKSSFYWRGVTRIDSITENNLRDISQNGCKELAVGIEHISSSESRPLKATNDQLDYVANMCKKYKISLKGLMMLGYLNQTIEDVTYMKSKVSQLNIPFRFTGFTPLNILRNMSIEELDKIIIEQFDRRTFFYSSKTKLTCEEFFNNLLIHSKNDENKR